MKCKDCKVDCHYRTSDGEKECMFQNHIIQVPDQWQGVRIQAAIAAMQGLLSNSRKTGSVKDYVEAAIDYANTIVGELKKK